MLGFGRSAPEGREGKGSEPNGKWKGKGKT